MMNVNEQGTIKLENDQASVMVNPCGGAITSFCLKGNPVNPLSFIFSKAQMPANNQAGASYQGHFLCLGRWGPPSKGEISAGLPNHGEAANKDWTIDERKQQFLQMHTIAAKEGLHVDRAILLNPHQPAYEVKEAITNINPLGRPYNVVQHPTLAAPFLDENTVVDCNASGGFDQVNYKDAVSNLIQWPHGQDKAGNLLDLRKPGLPYNGVFSFIVDQAMDRGWITAFSPAHNLLIGYTWPRIDYPWIHLWQHYQDEKLQYRGIEFGTAGIHQPFGEILDTASVILDEKTFAYIDAGETTTKSYLSFTLTPPAGFSGVDNISFTRNGLTIYGKGDTSGIKMKI